MRRLTLCADDYGLSEEVNTAILSLVRQGRLNAVSCMAGAVLFDAPALLSAVAKAPIRVEVGLHLTLTQYAPLTRMSRQPVGIGAMLVLSHLGRLRQDEIGVELRAQYDAFIAAVGTSPAFLDGHQHVHLLPQIREEVLRLAQLNAVRVRSCRLPGGDVLSLGDPRAGLLAWLSGPLRRRLTSLGVAQNDVFYGVNSFDERVAFRDLMRRWLALAANRTGDVLMMCHPGGPGTAPDDPIAGRRPQEFAYLASNAFAEDLRAHGFTLGAPIA